MRLSWGAIFAGTVVALGIWVLLYTLGLAIGLTAADPAEGFGGVPTPGVGAGLWSLITPIIALFVGGLVASRGAGIIDKKSGALHGSIVWGLTTLVAVALFAWGLVATIRTSVSVGRTAVGAAGDLVSGAAQGGQNLLQQVNVDAQQILQPINQRRTEQGLEPISVSQFQAAAQDAFSTAIREGRFDRQLFINSLVEQTGISRQEANQAVAQVESQLGQAGQQLGQVGQQIGTGVAQVAQTTGTAMWFLFFSQLLSLVSAVLGASIGVTKRQRIAAERVAPVEPTPPTGGRREVYP